MIGHSRDALIPGGDLSALIARLEAAEAGSRELDAAIWAASNGYELVRFDGAGWLYKMHPDDIQRHERAGYISSYTTSLDAALALAERVLPGFTWRVQRHTSGMFDAALWADPDDACVGYGRTPSPALALCIAVLKAIQHASHPTAGYEANGVVSPNLNPKAQGEVG